MLSLHAVLPISLLSFQGDRRTASAEFDTVRQYNGIFCNSGHFLSLVTYGSAHQETMQRTSPPIPCSRACRSLMTPAEVETIATPRPDRKSTRLNSSHYCASRMPAYA